MVGIALKEMVRRAILEIRRQRFIFEAQMKPHYDGEKTDLVTTADREAQRIYLKMLRECFPGFGIIAEEDELREECTLDRPLYFTLDPLDGTKAFGRRQSTGVGTMIALLEGTEVLSAYVGDVMTQEIYGFRPDSEKVHRISEYEVGETLQIDPRPLSKTLLSLRHSPWNYQTDVPRLAKKFREIEVEGGSIGVNYARLWKQETGALLLRPAHDTPWDCAPIIGISRKLGFVTLKPEGDGFVEFDYLPPLNVTHRQHEILIIHRQHLEALGA